MQKPFRLISIALVFSLAFMFTACGRKAVPKEKEDDVTRLWIVTEKDFSVSNDGINSQTGIVINAFEKAHENVEIDLEILPDRDEQAEEREIRLEQIRTEIMAGKGPDGYLMPNYPPYYEDPLFSDINQAMRNGVFADVSTWYDVDGTLGKEELVTEVMDGGVLDGARYILPLRYDFSVLCADTQTVEAAGIDLEKLASNVYTLVDTVEAMGKGEWISGFQLAECPPLQSFAFMPETLDYDNGEVLIDAEEMAEFIRREQNLKRKALNNFGADVSFSSYVYSGECLSEEIPIIVADVREVLDIAAIAKAEDREMTAIPLRAADGDLVAGVAYYAAVGAGSETPELVYQFLREFLTEESQFEHNRVSNPNKSTFGWLEVGLPVRARDSAQDVWEIWYKVNKDLTADEQAERGRKSRSLSAQITSEDLSVLDAAIDRVRFVSKQEWEAWSEICSQLYDLENGVFMDVDEAVLAEEFIDLLEWHLAEG